MADELTPLEAKWYVVHTYSGYENKVKTTLDSVIENRGLQEMIQEVSVPMDEQIEVKDGKKKTTMKKRYPGYVLIKMVYTEEIWYIVRNTRGVTGFVGPNANKPLPLTDEELTKMGLESTWVPSVDYSVGDSVKIITGPFADCIGLVEDMNLEKHQVRVRISMFGRETPIELEFAQVVRM
ncbi:MAG TPA: transcription termination/antitermination protein NusG [Bacillota bacterium]|nr:transcription termination/antitermination protein NusG [Bacillota bacterium]